MFIFTSGRSALLGRPRSGLSIWLSLPAIFNTLFWVYIIFFTRKRTKHENARSPPFSHDTKNGRRRLLGAQSINTERASLIGDFRVAFRLCFKARPSAKSFIWKWVLCIRKSWFIYMWIKLIFTRKARFETEANGNLEIEYLRSLITSSCLARCRLTNDWQLGLANRLLYRNFRRHYSRLYITRYKNYRFDRLRVGRWNECKLFLSLIHCNTSVAVPVGVNNLKPKTLTTKMVYHKVVV